MLLDYVPAEHKEEIWYELCYDDGKTTDMVSLAMNLGISSQCRTPRLRILITASLIVQSL